MKTTNYYIPYILYFFLNFVNIYAQNYICINNSIEIKKLTNRYEYYYNNFELYKKNSPIALDIIEIINNYKSHYFQIKKSDIKARQSVTLKTEEKYDNALTMLLENISYKEQIKKFIKAQLKMYIILARLEVFDYPNKLSYAYTILRQRKQFKKSIIYSEKNLVTSHKSKDSLSLGFAYFNLGVTYYELKKYRLAIEALKKSIQIEYNSASPSRIKSRYKKLSDCYIAIGDYKNGYYYSTKYIEENEGEIETYKNALKLESKLKYERQYVIDSLKLVQNKKEIEISIKRKAKNQFRIVVSALLLLVIILWLLYYKKTQKMITTELKNKLLHSEIESKKKDLSEFALNLNYYKEWTKDLFKQFEKLKYYKGDEKDKEIKILEKEILDKLNYNEINKEFNKRLDNLSNTFYDNLKKRYPNLTKNDIRLCTLIKLKIDSPEIANLQNISINSVNTSRYRLRKKLTLSSSENLDDFIREFI